MSKGSACSSCTKPDRWPRRAGSVGRQPVEPAQEYGHFLFRLLVALGVRRGDSALPRLMGAGLVAIGLQRLAQQFPGSGVFRIELDAAAQVICRPRRLPGIHVALAEAETKHRIVNALGR